MKVRITHHLKIEMSDEEFSVMIHALQSHVRYGGNEWPGEETLAERMRGDLIDAVEATRHYR